MIGSREPSGVTGAQVVVGTVCIGLERDTYIGSGGRNDGGGGGDLQDIDGDVLNRWEDTTEKLILGTEPHPPLSYAGVLESHHQIMSITGGHGCWL